MPRTFSLQDELTLPLPREEVFAFFADATNLEAITPPWLNFRILTPTPIEMRTGALIDYRLRLHGIPLSWRTHISVWEPARRFVDEPLRGPSSRWRHEHLFQDVGGGTRVIDRVEYAHLGGRWLDQLFVRPDLERIFAYRKQRTRELLTATVGPE